MDYYQQARPQASAAAPTAHTGGYVYAHGQSTNSAQMYYPQAMTTTAHHAHQQQPNAYAQPHYAMPTAGNAAPAAGIDYGTHFVAGAQTQNSMNAHGQTGMTTNVQRRPRGLQNTGAELQMHAAPPPNNELPLRLIVDARHVGALIGSGGSNIKEMSKDTKARITVDSHKTTTSRDGHAEKVVQIIGSPENISRACVRVLEVVQKELEKDESRESNGEVELRLRAANQLVGRLIGKGGATIKKIMQDTGTSIYVSNEQQSRNEMGVMSPYEVAALNLERTITVKGPSIDAISQAESRISQKLRQSFETDLQQRMQLGMGAATGGLPMISGGIMNPFSMDLAALSLAGRGIVPQPHLGLTAGLTSQASNITKTLRVYVPANMVGAVIGSKGAHIKNIMRNSGANVRVDGGGEKKEAAAAAAANKEKEKEESGAGTDEAGKEKEKETDGEDAKEKKENAHDDKGADKDEEEREKEKGSASPIAGKEQSSTGHSGHAGEGNEKKQEDERLITITGNELQVQRAQFFIFSRIAEQSGQLFEEVKLRSEVSVPSKLVGRIIGKGGQNVRELQRLTGATVKIPDDEPKTTPTASGEAEGEKKETGTGEAHPSENSGVEKKEVHKTDDQTLVRIIGTYPATHHVQARIAQLAVEFSKLNTENTTTPKRGGNSAAGDNQGLPKPNYYFYRKENAYA